MTMHRQMITLWRSCQRSVHTTVSSSNSSNSCTCSRILFGVPRNQLKDYKLTSNQFLSGLISTQVRPISCYSSSGYQQASPSAQHETPEDTAPNKGTVSNLHQLQSRQKRLLEQPEEDEPHSIYEGVLAAQLKTVKLFSIFTSVAGITLQPVLLQQASEMPMAATVAAFTMVGFFTYLTPIFIHSIARKYVTQMTYDPQQDLYTAVTYNFFLRRIETVFKMDEVVVPDVPGPFTTFHVVKTGKKKPKALFVAPEAFSRPGHYGRIMGFDKPIDLRLSHTDKK